MYLDRPENDFHSSLELLTALCETNANLFRVYDVAIHSIRLTSSLHLGLGSSSCAVSRVQDAMVGRTYNVENEDCSISSRAKQGKGDTSVVPLVKPPHLLAVGGAREVLLNSMR